MSIDSVDNVSIKVSGGVSVYKQSCQEHDQYWQNQLTFKTCCRSFGASFAHALGVILPSSGNSEVIVLSAGYLPLDCEVYQ